MTQSSLAALPLAVSKAVRNGQSDGEEGEEGQGWKTSRGRETVRSIDRERMQAREREGVTLVHMIPDTGKWVCEGEREWRRNEIEKKE